jgi:Icc-related predicted phosphoesterase
MKLQIISDLHLEFGSTVRIDNAGADILCLAGDICLARDFYKNNERSRKYRQFFDQVSKEFDTILYIMGNHEHYSGRWNLTSTHLREALEPWDNIILMDDSWLNFGKTRIVGTTLWSSLNNADPITMYHLKSVMNDYHTITIERSGIYHKLRPEDTLDAYNRAVETIKLATQTWDGDVVVLGHHAPSRASIHERYRHDQVGSGGYCSDLDDLILDQPKIKLWIHGHVHSCFDYQIGDCRVICNPHGYPTEHGAFNPNLIVEV